LVEPHRTATEEPLSRREPCRLRRYAIERRYISCIGRDDDRTIVIDAVEFFRQAKRKLVIHVVRPDADYADPGGADKMCAALTLQPALRRKLRHLAIGRVPIGDRRGRLLQNRIGARTGG